jgi:hypothetical protein
MPKKKSVAKKKVGKAKPTKADFVRSQPADMPAKEVLAKAKAVGITLTGDAVYKTRSLDKTRAKKSGASAKKKTGKAPSTQTRGRSPDKKNRVLELVSENPSWTAAEIAKAAKCTPNYVYSVWGKTSGTRSTTKPSASNGSSPDAKAAFTQAVQALGVSRARKLLDILAKLEQA